VEVTRNAIAAAGYAGYAATIAQDIANLTIYGMREPHIFAEPSSDYLNKYTGNALTALSMGYGHEPREFALEKIEEIAAADQEAHRFTHPPYELVARGFHLFSPAALEAFCAVWGGTQHDKAIHVARAIGAARYERFSGQAIDLMMHQSSDDVQTAAAEALSHIGGKRAAEALHKAVQAVDLQPSWRAVASLYHYFDSWPRTIEVNIPKALAYPYETGNLMRISAAMARRGLSASDARNMIDSSRNTLARASSAVAYAILDKPGARDFLAGNHEEASDIAETVLLLCAQIIAGDHGKGDLLHKTLAEGNLSPWNLERGHPLWRYIILACLAEAEPSGARAAAWARQWRDTGTAVERQIRDLRQRMFYP
jgi:hypothetical protein